MHKGHLTQIDKYGGREGYSAEMRRRRSLYIASSRLSRAKLEKYLADGYSQNQIAAQEGLSQSHISYLINKKYRLNNEKH